MLGHGKTSKVEILSRYVESGTRCRREVRDGERVLALLSPEVSSGSTRGCVMFGRLTQEHPYLPCISSYFVSGLLPTISSNLMIICILKWKKLGLREVTQLINGAAQNSLQPLWLPNLHSFHYFMLLQRMEPEGRTV